MTERAIKYTVRIVVGVARLAGAAIEKAFDLTVKATEGAVDLAQDALDLDLDMHIDELQREIENMRAVDTN